MHTKSEEDKPVIRHLYDTLGRGDTDSASPGADVKARKIARAHCHRVGVAVSPETAAREKAVMTRLVLAALSGLFCPLSAICLTVIYSTVPQSRHISQIP